MTDAPNKFARARFFQASTLLAHVLTAREPADQVMEKFFRHHKQMGSKDRGFAAETVYTCLRRQREFSRLYESFGPFRDPHNEARHLVATALIVVLGWNARAFDTTDFADRAEALVKVIRTFDRSSLSFAERNNLPDALADALRAQYGDEEAEAIARALNEAAPVDIRVNTRLTTREDVKAALDAAGYDYALTPLSPWGLRRETRGPLFHTDSFKAGHFELQDEASQLVAWLLAPKPKQTVVDFCAGAGGKTLHIADLMMNRGSVIACDIAKYRLDKMKPRVVRAKLDNVRSIPLDEANEAALRALLGTADAVLVDAPCSGSGTLRRNPDMKWRDLDLADLNAQQAEILAAASDLVKPGGRLVYATCSLLHAENEAIVDAFLAAHPQFEREAVSDAERDAPPVLNAIAAIDAPLAERLRQQGTLNLLPNRHQTDGFFAQRMRRKN